MKSELLAKSPLLALPLCALVVFFAFFVAMVFFTMKRRAPAYDPVARLALEGDPESNEESAR